MRRILAVYVIIGLVVLSPFSEFCHGDPDTILVDASENKVHIDVWVSWYLTELGLFQITLEGSWFYDSTDDNPQTYIVCYHRLDADEPYEAEVLVVGETYNWEIADGNHFIFYFPEPGNVSDNHGMINVRFLKNVQGGTDILKEVEVKADNYSVRIDTDAKKHEFLDNGNYELNVSGEWNDENDDPHDYVLAYYSGTESEMSEKLVKGNKQRWNVSSGDIAYFYIPERVVDESSGAISIEISAVQDPVDDSKWYLEPVWIGIWLSLISIAIAVIGFMAARSRR